MTEQDEAVRPAPAMTADLVFKACDYCGAYHRSGRLAPFCPACGKDHTALATPPPVPAHVHDPDVCDDCMAMVEEALRD